MASAAVVATAETAVSTAGTSHAITLPAGIVATDLVLITMDIGSTSATLNSLANWTEILDEASANGLKILIYTGTGVPSNPTFTSSASTRSATIAWRIAGANKSITPEIGTTATGTSATPDPPSITPTGGSKDYLFIAFAGMAGEEADDDTWGNTPPTNYLPSPPLQKSCGTVGTNLGGLIVAASRRLTASSENPGTFGVDVSAAWRAQTIAVHPIPSTTYDVAVDTTVAPLYHWKLGEASGSATVEDRQGNYPVPLTVDTGATLGATGLVSNNSSDTAVTVDGTTAGSVFGASGSRPTVTATSFSWSVWFKVDATNTLTGFQYICALTGTGADHSGICLNGNKVEGFFQSGGTYATADSTTSVVAGGTYRASCSYNGTNLVVRVNGVPETTTSPVGSPNTGSGFSAVVGSDWAQTQRFKGVVDEVAFYASAISDAKDAAEYAAGSPAASFSRTASDTVTVSDAATRTRVRARTAAETTTVSDAAAGVSSGPFGFANFTGSNVALNSYVPEQGGTFSRNQGTGIPYIGQQTSPDIRNMVTPAGAGTSHWTQNTSAATTADYHVKVLAKYITPGISGHAFGVVGRGNAAAGTGYYFGWDENSSSWVLGKLATWAGGVTSLATSAATLVNGTSYEAVLEMVGTAIKGYVDGVAVCSVTDSSFTTGTRAGVADVGSGRLSVAGAVSGISGIFFDKFEARNGAFASGPASLTGAASDSVTASDAATRDLLAFTRTATDTVATSDAATRVEAGARTATESTTSVSDAAARAAFAPARTATDNTSVSDAAARAAFARTRTAADTVTSSDAATGIRGTTRTASDSVSVSDSAARATLARTRTVADTTSVADAASRATAPARAASDTVTAAADTATRTGGARPRTAADSVALGADIAATSGTPVRAAADTVATSDAAARATIASTRAAADSSNVSDAASRSAPVTRTAADSATVSDTASRATIGQARTTTDSTTISDAAVGVGGVPARTAADSISTSDSASRAIIGSARTAADSTSVSDAATGLGSIARIAIDTVTRSDTATGVFAFGGRNSADTVAVIDQIVRAQAFQRAAVDAVTAADDASASAVFPTFTGTSVEVEGAAAITGAQAEGFAFILDGGGSSRPLDGAESATGLLDLDSSVVGVG